MKTIHSTLLHSVIFATFAIGGYMIISMSPWMPIEKETLTESVVAGKASISNFQKNYERWSQAYRATEPVGPVVTLLWSRGLSSEYTAAKGIVQFNMDQETVSVRIKGLEDHSISEVWLVDNQPGTGRSVAPESGDNLMRVGTLKFDGDNAWLDAQITDLKNFQTDLVVVSRRDKYPDQQRTLVGTMSLFQKLFHYPKQTPLPEPQAPAQRMGTNFSLIKEAAATGYTPAGFFPGVPSGLINNGRSLFFEETFNGNGRTCGTCHKEEDNMALGIKTIASLPPDDPLFIVEQEFRQDGSPNALFNEFRMEKPALMRKVGLIVENLDGFRNNNGEFTSRVAMRAPQHVLSIRTTLAPPPIANDDGTLPVDPLDLVFAERTGWSGDGTPTGFNVEFFESNGRELTGSLRDFTIGAIVQHFPLTLERSTATFDESGNPRQPDFRFATEDELDALEAFMLSIGRQEENQDLNAIQLTDEVADRGRLNFMGFNVFDTNPADGRPPLNCNACHFNGGANTDPTFPFPPSVTPNHDLADLAAAGGSIRSHNRSFGPQVERLADQAGDIIVQVVDDPSVRGNCFRQGYAAVPLLPDDLPDDQEADPTPSRGCSANRFDNGFDFAIGQRFRRLRIADNRFNAPPVFEAMDNPPFFHGHQINTVEGSVAFYATNRHLRDGTFLPAIVPLNGAQVINVARFMRVMGADFNAESAKTLLEKAVLLNANSRKRTNIHLALAEIEDAVELLEAVQLHFDDAVPLFEETTIILESALASLNVDALELAIAKLTEAQNLMINRG